MRKPERILVAVDFSPASESALAYAVTLAKPLGARIDALYVHDKDEANPRLQLDDERSAAMALDALIDSHAHTEVEIARHVRMGSPKATIVAMTELLGSDMIVLGTHGRHGLERALLGSVAESVVRSSSVPVLLLRQAAV